MTCVGLKQINNKDEIIENNLEDILIQVDNVYHYLPEICATKQCLFFLLSQVAQSSVHSHTNE